MKSYKGSIEVKKLMMLRLGSVGDDVRRLQERLRELGLYTGRIDGVFGGATFSAVKRFQAQKALEVDGIVGEKTWESLFENEKQSFSTSDYPLDYRCLVLTATFETGKPPLECFSAISGNFDGQVMSFGALQWNFGQGSLQRLLKDMLNDYRSIMEQIFGEYLNVIQTVINENTYEAVEFAISIQHPVKYYIYEPWRGMFRELGRTKEFQAIQLRHTEAIFNSALKLCKEYELNTERAVALMFDIVVQCGSIKKTTHSKIMADFGVSPLAEVEKLIAIAQRISEQVNPRWKEDVLSRKLCIAKGYGFVHGIYYDIEKQFGISDKVVTAK